jgi:hypothetical protein
VTPVRRRSGGDDLPNHGTGDGAPALLSRRAVIGGLAASGLTAGMVGSLLTACSDRTDSGATGPSGAPDPTEPEQALVKIGRRYRADHPDEDDRALLLDRLGLEEGTASSPSGLSTLDAQVAEDYGSGRTVRIDGWVLSETEGRAAALVSMA